MYRFLLAFLVLSTSVFADYTEIYNNSVNIPFDIIKIEDGYLVNGIGNFVAKIDTSANVDVLMNSSNPSEISLISRYENNNYILNTNMQNNDAIVLKTNDFVQYDTVFSKQNIGANNIYVNQNGLFLPLINIIGNEFSIVRIENGGISSTTNLNNAVMEIIQLSETEVIALGSFPNHSLIYSNDNGLSFNEIPLEDQNLERIKVYDSNIFISTKDGRLIKSTDRGITWETIFNDADVIGSAIFYICNNDTIYFAPSINNKRSILYKTEDGGDSWKEIYRLDSEAISSILVDGNKALLGTTGGKILYNDNFTSVQDWKVIKPNSLKVFPNPSTDYLTIDTKEEIDSFKIVDLLGNDVSSTVKLEGKTIDLSGLASGTYTLIIDGKTAQIAVNR